MFAYFCFFLCTSVLVLQVRTDKPNGPVYEKTATDSVVTESVVDPEWDGSTEDPESASDSSEFDVSTEQFNGTSSFGRAPTVAQTEQSISSVAYSSSESTPSKKPKITSHIMKIPRKECIPRTTCSAINATSKDQGLCNCDDKCVKYKDCCLNSRYYDKIEMSKPSSFTCQDFIYNSTKITSVYIKSDCDPNWKNSNISSLCTAEPYYRQDIQNLTLNIPVTGSKTNITYRNVFCAICNYDRETTMWETVVFNECDRDQDSALTLPKKLPVNTTKNLQFDGFQWFFEKDGGVYICNKGDIRIPERLRTTLDGCDISLKGVKNALCQGNSSHLQEQCNSIFDPVYFDTESPRIFFKNKYCAECQSQTEFEKLCPNASNIDIGRDLIFKVRTSFRFNAGRSLQALFDPIPMVIDDSCFESKNPTCSVSAMMISQNPDEKVNLIFAWYTSIALVVSIILLCAHLTIFVLVRELQTLGGKNLASYCLALGLGYSSFLVGGHFHGQSCVLISAITYYFFLSSFTWLFTISFDLWSTIWSIKKKLRSPGNRKARFLIYSCCNWIICVLPVLLAVYFESSEKFPELSPQFNQKNETCWFHNDRSLRYFFVMPVFCIILANLIFFSHTSYMIHTNKLKSTSSDEEAVNSFALYSRLAILSGATWITVFLAVISGSKVMWFIFIFLNTGLGIFIFVGFTCRKGTYRRFIMRFGVGRK